MASKKMTRVSNTSFSYELNDVAVASYEYKLIALYSDATEIDWSHEIDDANQPLAILEADDGTIKSLGSRTYNFATKMPETLVLDGAVVRITFANPVPNTVDIVFAGGLTNWCTTPETLAKGIMSRTSQYVYSWAIPSTTRTGTYKFKIAAMAKNSGATQVDYSTLVYGVLATDESLVVDTSTAIYPLEALDTDLSELGALGLANGFLADMQTVCGTTASEWNDNHTGSALNTAWATWKEKFESLTAGAKTQFGSSENATIVRAKGLYLHILNRYGFSAWTGAPAASALLVATPVKAMNNAQMIIVVVASIAAVSAFGIFLAIKRRKEN